MTVNITGFQRARRLRAAQAATEAQVVDDANVLPGQKEPENGQDQQPNEPFDVEALTKNEIIAELEKRNVDFNARDSKEALKGLLIDAING